MSYNHPTNSVYLPQTRPPSHATYDSYAAPGMAGKPQTSQQMAQGGRYAPMYFVQGSSPYQPCYAPGAEAKYQGGTRGATEAAGGTPVLVGMSPQQMIYPAQHMPQSAQTVILPGGQQVITMAHQQLPMYQAAGHQPHMRFNVSSSQPPTGQYGLGMPSQMQQQQPYYKQGYTGNQVPTQSPLQKREKKSLAIVNPDTGKEVDVKGDQVHTSVSNDGESSSANCSATADPENSVCAPPAPHPQMAIAAQFAAQVAATLNPVASSSSGSVELKTTAPPADRAPEFLAEPSASGAQVAVSQSADIEDSEIAADVPSSDATPLSQDSCPLNSVPESSTEVPVEAESTPSQCGSVSSCQSSTPELGADSAREEDAEQQQQQTKEDISESSGLQLEKSKLTKTVPSSSPSSSKIPAAKENPKHQPVEQQMKTASPAVPAAAAVPSSAVASGEIVEATSPGTVPDNGKDYKKKNKKKAKDLNTKGKVLQGSDMDAFIDEGSSAVGGQKMKCPTLVTKDETTELAAAADGGSGDVHEESVSLNTAAASSTQPEESQVDTDSSQVTTLEETTSKQRAPEPEKNLADDSAANDCDRRTEATVEEEETALQTDASKGSPTEVSKDEETVASTRASVDEDDKSEGASGVVGSADVEKVCDVKTFQAGSALAAGGASAADEVTSPLNDGEVDDVESSVAETATEIPAETKSSLKYTYSEDQWSPLNPEGKKQYDRTFMLQLQFADPSLTRPVGLPQLPDIILNEPRMTEFTRQASQDLQSPVDYAFTPGFIRQTLAGSGAGHRGPQRRAGGGGGGGGGNSGGAGGNVGGMKRGSDQRKVINLSLEHNTSLHQSENAWKPAFVKKESKESEPATEELYKKVRGILNKLTPQKFQTLVEQVKLLPINSEETLKGCIDILFEKAISEPNFSVAYANMAKCLMAVNVPLDSDPKQMVSFRKLLLNKCQQEFEKDKLEELDIENLQKLIDQAESDEKRKQLTEQRDATMYRAKRRSLGNIRFIGELFKLKMLTEKIMHECLHKLLKSDSDEDSLECLCQLLQTIGKDIDLKQPSQGHVNGYFTRLQQLVDQKKASARIRFMIQDVIELRKSGWVPRREKNDPKTIEQIHKEAEREEQEKQLHLQKITLEQRNRRGGPSARSMGAQPSAPAPQAGDDGWTAVGRAPKSIVDPARMKLTKHTMDETVQLGPGGRGMSSWHRGSSGGGGGGAGKNASQENDRPTSTPNRFSALGGFGSESMDARSRGGARGGGGANSYTGRLSGPQHRGPVSRQSQERVANDNSFRVPSAGGRNARPMSPAGSRSVSRETRHGSSKSSSLVDRPRAVAGDVEGNASVETVVVEKEISEAEVEKKTKALIDEYLHGHDIKEATLCVKELGSSKSLTLFVYHSLLHNLERSSQARNFTGMLHHHLVSTKQMTMDSYVQGLRSVLEIADEMVIDIPRIWLYLAEFVCPMVEDGSISMGFLRLACEPLVVSEKPGIVVAQVLLELSHKLGHHKVAELWRQSGLSWTDFMSADAVQSFLEEQKLTFTEEHSKPSSSANAGPTGINADQVQDHLSKLLDSNSDVEKVIDWIDENVDESTAHSSSFIRAFATSLCRSCLKHQKNSITVEQEKFKKYLPVLSKYINHEVPLEVQVLFALQALVTKMEHPSGLLREFFDTLYDDEVVTEGAFYEWKDSAEPSEAAGKGVALSSVNQFFHWLENDEES